MAAKSTTYSKTLQGKKVLPLAWQGAKSGDKGLGRSTPLPSNKSVTVATRKGRKK